MLKLVNEWLQFKQLNEDRSISTIKKYRYYLELYFSFCETSLINPMEPSQLQLEQFTGLCLHQMKLVPQSRRTAVAALRGFYEYIFEKGYAPANYASSLPYPASSQKIPVAMGLRHFEQLLQSCDLESFTGIRDAAIIALFIPVSFVTQIVRFHLILVHFQFLGVSSFLLLLLFFYKKE